MKARKHKSNQTGLLNLYNIELHKKLRLIIIFTIIMSKLSHIQKILI